MHDNTVIFSQFLTIPLTTTHVQEKVKNVRPISPDLSLPPQCTRDLRSSGGVTQRRFIFSDVSGIPNVPVYNGQRLLDP